MGRHVLIVDDDASIRSLLHVALETEGLDVETARDGREAVVKAFDDPPAAVVLDIMMPGLDGWEVARRLKMHESTRHVPVVFLSARAQDVDVLRGRELGAVAYVTKPFDLADLCELVHELLDGELLAS